MTAQQAAHAAARSPLSLVNDAGLRIELLSHGAIRRIECHGLLVNLFPGHEVEGGPANLWLRRQTAAGVEAVPLLGPRSPLSPCPAPPEAAGWAAAGHWQGLCLRLQLRLAAAEPVWFWHLQVDNETPAAQTIDLVLVQDIGLAPYATIRLNEHYVSHYVDLTPLADARHGCVLAARQNLAQGGRHPWALLGSLRRGVSYATDGLQVQGLAVRAGGLPQGITQGLPGVRLQHEHALAAIQDEAVTLAPGACWQGGFFGLLQDDHAAATGAGDLACVAAALTLPEARQPTPVARRAAQTAQTAPAAQPEAGSLFARTPMLQAQDLDAAQVEAHWGRARRHEESEGGELRSFFCAEQTHVVLRAKELCVQRPHGHILRTGAHLVPDETALTSTVWMAGVFHSMLTQGHVSINRCLSTVRGWLGQYRAHGQRIFVHLGGAWQQLGVPSAFEIEPDGCRWLYQHAGGVFEVRSRHDPHGPLPHALGLHVRVLAGAPLCLLVTHHLALAGDDGDGAGPAPMQRDAGGVFIGVPAGSALAARFPHGGFRIEPDAGTLFAQVGGDELLYADGQSRGQPFVCIASGEVRTFGLRLRCQLITDAPAVAAGEALALSWAAPATGARAAAAQRLAEIAPWYLHNALVHYLAPRGLEQYTGGGWGTRDVCQGPLEMLLALDRPAPVRDLLLRVFAAQNADGDWPQWFMFFERERHNRAGDAHGDIVFWPLLGLARYLIATDDAALLDERLPYHAGPGAPAETAPLWQHVQRALAVIDARRIAGTQLAAYGHGDWNDSLQPADPALRERLCSAWTVTLHHQMLAALARALRGIGQASRAAPLEADAAAVQADFQRLLVVDGVVTGYALFAPGAPPQLLLHPTDRVTGVRYSLLAMMHAILEDMLSPAQAQEQLRLIEAHLTGPDGARLFDRPLPYRGGPEVLFQRAESSAFFGREIGVMYMHAHLRWAETLAHVGDAERFFEALCKSHPIALRELVPPASPRQANCYFSSSDAAFADRYEAQMHYARVARGEVALDGGWRIYSSGPGIAIGLIVGRFLGLRREKSTLVVDPVMPSALAGLRTSVSLAGHRIEVEFRPGPQGCGPTALTLDGQPLPYARGANPYRSGAARVPMAAILARLSGGSHTLVVHTG